MAKQTKTIEQLEKEYNQYSGKARWAKEQIEELHDRKTLPAYKKKFEGKYFTYRNSYSCPGSTKESWNIYVFVERVEGIRKIKGWRFETDKYGKIEIQQSDDLGENLLQTPITKAEFTRAYKRMLNRIPTVA